MEHILQMQLLPCETLQPELFLASTQSVSCKNCQVTGAPEY